MYHDSNESHFNNMLEPTRPLLTVYSDSSDVCKKCSRLSRAEKLDATSTQYRLA